MTPTSKKPAPTPCIININTYLCCVLRQGTTYGIIEKWVFYIRIEPYYIGFIAACVPCLTTSRCRSSRTLASIGKQAAFLLCMLKFHKTMPKYDEIRVDAKHSTVLPTSGHDTATPLVFDPLEVKDLLEFTDHLGGEDAIRRLSVVLDYPEEDYAADLAMRGLLHYYYNVSYLVDRLKEMVAVSRAAQRRGKKTRKEVVK